jgi:hypothetical protein
MYVAVDNRGSCGCMVGVVNFGTYTTLVQVGTKKILSHFKVRNHHVTLLMTRNDSSRRRFIEASSSTTTTTTTPPGKFLSFYLFY